MDGDFQFRDSGQYGEERLLQIEFKPPLQDWIAFPQWRTLKCLARAEITTWVVWEPNRQGRIGVAQVSPSKRRDYDWRRDIDLDGLVDLVADWYYRDLN